MSRHVFQILLNKLALLGMKYAIFQCIISWLTPIKKEYPSIDSLLIKLNILFDFNILNNRKCK